MRFFRALLSIIFLGIIVFGITKRYNTDNTIQKTDIMKPVWDKIASVVTKKQETKRADAPIENDTVIAELHQDVTTGTLSKKAFNKVLGDSKLLGPKDADWTLLSYCDFDSVYCKQMIEEGTLASYQLISRDNLKVAHKGYTTSFSGLESTYNVHHARRCVQEQGTGPQWITMFPTLFDFPYQTAQDLVTLGEQLGVTGFNECILSTNSTTQQKADNTLAKELFNIKALPTLIFYNQKTQDRYSIPGLYTNEELASTFTVLFNQ